ncbi:hypothetical protein RCO28_34260 [Streptomyces sp. LHD-70]|uniref:hypothetical protein n=1 Tax=Streptomyces sp. LHD-70 TaxID=3072140 RepID=UPI00280F7BA0|nr:hypothetical protein [Streptomyces sp. LHD-70]MDQ8707497.1 hypothetical protein [Streptomyces sp. LHD-70]
MSGNPERSGAPLPCWAKHPDGKAFCTEIEWHKGSHLDVYAKVEWPSRGPQASRLSRQ